MDRLWSESSSKLVIKNNIQGILHIIHYFSHDLVT